MLTDLQARDLLRGLTHAANEGTNQREVFARLETLLLHGLERDELEGLAAHYFDALDRFEAEIDRELVRYWHEATASVHEARASFGRGNLVEAIERASIAQGPAVLGRRRRRRSLRTRGAAR